LGKTCWGCTFSHQEIVGGVRFLAKVGQRGKSCKGQTFSNLENLGGGSRFLLHLIGVSYFLLYYQIMTKYNSQRFLFSDYDKI